MRQRKGSCRKVLQHNQSGAVHTTKMDSSYVLIY